MNLPDFPIAPLLPDELARRAEARALLGDIHRLPERQRSVLVMSAIEGLSHEEISTKLEISAGNSRVRLGRAMKELKHLAAKEGTR